ncbi:hypothetical protein B0T20DRAFT_452414 [Sordaria brevicollis]|uniref:Uncharacterized protein n=1 Tax=Sordaria brevicollis TaxID=83679 RepID=A0AAE0PHY6_SORBR|nr:hypothetical protein B0T20DRAFT_452414 [Sordaria brevicollis]
MAATEPSSSTQAAQEGSDHAGETARQGAPLLPQVLPAPHPIVHEKNGMIPQQQPAPVQPLGYGGTYHQQYLPRAHGSEIAYTTRWHIVKLVLQTISVVCSACILGIGLALGAYSRRWGAPWEIDILFSVLATAAGMTILWTMSEFLVICASKHRRGIHPGAHVGLHLIIAIVTGLGAAFAGWITIEYSYYYDDDPYMLPGPINGLQRGLFALSILLLIIHLFLFVRACVETHAVNSTNKARRTVTYIRVPVGVPMPMGQVPQNMVAGQHPDPPQQNNMFSGYYAPVAPQSPSAIPSGSQQQPGVPPLQGYYASPA